MTKATVYRYKVYDFTADDFVVSTRMATRSRIKHIRGEIIPGTKTEIDDKHLEDGWTAKSFAENLAVDQTSRTRGRTAAV
jgi:hypothetical protein